MEVGAKALCRERVNTSVDRFERSHGAEGSGGYDGRRGAVAEWLGRGLQSLVQRFESARRLSRAHPVAPDDGTFRVGGRSRRRNRFPLGPGNVIISARW